MMWLIIGVAIVAVVLNVAVLRGGISNLNKGVRLTGDESSRFFDE